MEKLNKEPKAHLFICCRQKENKPCCAAKGGEDVFTTLRTWAKENSLNSDIKITKSACLGSCESGVTACLYPQNLWFHKITLDDIAQLKEMLLQHASDSPKHR